MSAVDTENVLDLTIVLVLEDTSVKNVVIHHSSVSTNLLNVLMSVVDMESVLVTIIVLVMLVGSEQNVARIHYHHHSIASESELMN